MTQGLADEEEPINGAEEEVPAVRPTKPKTRKQKIRAKALKWQDMRRKKLKEAKKRLLEFDRYLLTYLKKKNNIIINYHVRLLD